jgi:hypothetical protein
MSDEFGKRWVAMIERQAKWAFIGIAIILAIVIVTNLVW